MKFADADLLGMPVQLIVGAKGLARGIVERKVRATGERDELPLDGVVAALAGALVTHDAARDAAGVADAREAGARAADGDQWAVRAEVGRLPLHRLPRRRRHRARQPQRAAAHPLLPGARRAAARRAARPGGRRRRDRDHDRRTGSTSTCSRCASIPRRAASTMLAAETPASFVAFDLLAVGDEDLREHPFAERRAALEAMLGTATSPVHLTPASTAIPRSRRSGSTGSRAPGSTVSSPSRSTARTARASAGCSR